MLAYCAKLAAAEAESTSFADVTKTIADGVVASLVAQRALCPEPLRRVKEEIICHRRCSSRRFISANFVSANSFVHLGEFFCSSRTLRFSSTDRVRYGLGEFFY